MKMGVGRRPLYLPIASVVFGVSPFLLCGSFPPHWRKLPEKQALGATLDATPSLMYAPRSLFLHDCFDSLDDSIVVESRSQYKVIRCVKENVQFTSLDLVPIWTKAEEAQWLGTSGHRRQVETGKKGQLTHSLTWCQGRCTFRHLIYWFRNYLSPIKTKLNWQFGTNIHPSSNTVQFTFNAKHTDIHEPPLSI